MHEILQIRLIRDCLKNKIYEASHPKMCLKIQAQQKIKLSALGSAENLRVGRGDLKQTYILFWPKNPYFSL